MANREYFQGDSRQDSYEFVGRQGSDPRSNSPYPPNQQQGYGGSGYGGGNEQYGQQYGGQQQSQYPPQGRPSYGGGDSYSGQAPPSRYEAGGPPPAYGQQQNDPYLSQYQKQFGGGEGGYNQRPQEYPDSRGGHSPQPAYGQQNPAYGAPPGGPGGEEERGFLGAAAGAAAGGFGGHYGGKKMNHGVLGTVGGALGGAIAGSMLQDHFKDKHEEHKHQQQQQQQQHHGGPPPPGHYQQQHREQHHNFAGNFSASSSDITLDRDHDLIARCGDGGGGHRLTSLNLNECLTNEFGTLKWQRNGNFGGSARNVRLADGGRVLEAELADGGGGWRHAYIYLDERITNEGGELRYLD